MQNTTYSIIHDNTRIQFDIRFSQRKSVAVEIQRDGVVTVKAPVGMASETIRDMVRGKAEWIRDKQRAMKAIPVQRFVDGEKWCYLGIPLRLAIQRGLTNQVQIVGRRLVVETAGPCKTSTVQGLVEGFYRDEALRVFQDRLDEHPEWLEFLEVPAPTLSVRKMKRRWGSCYRNGRIILNWRLMQAPLSLIDYVIAHELCHLREMNHGRVFYRWLDCLVPDWRVRKGRLDELLPW